MIHESHPWRIRLSKDADLIDRWAAKTKITDYRSFLIEQKVFLAAYAMRKLVEAKKLSSSFDHKNLSCRIFPAFKEKKASPWNSHHFDEFFNLDSPSESTLNIRSLMDLLVHSFLFIESVREDNTIDGFLVNSDHKRSNLWFVNLSDFTATMRHVAADYVSSSVIIWDDKAQQWREWRGHGEPPDDFCKK